MSNVPVYLSNVVFHFKLDKRESLKCVTKFRDEEQAGRETYYIKFYHNFCVIKEGKISFIFFFTSGHVNCTGTKTLKVIKQTFKCINRVFGVRLKGKKLKISNSTWTGRCLCDQLDILSLVDGRIRVPEHWKISLRPGNFPAALIRQAEGPSGVLFKNGKYNIVGAVKRGPVKKLSSEIEELVRYAQSQAGPAVL